ncbi:MAG: cobalamin-dependent protein [Acidobacteriia bacterium]|nr:cobalamin-dependent protein [Terriglobia bacterium]
MGVQVSFADLTHTGQVVAANTFPYGISMVAAYAKHALGADIDAEIFKYPDDFASYLDRVTPQIACFSSFSWNIRLGHEYARRIKDVSPGTITCFGGPNFPDAPEEQAAFLRKYPSIDFYFEFEGEFAFVEFFRAMVARTFDAAGFKRERALVPNIRYLVDGEFVAAPLAPKIEDLNQLPSPHLTGLSDKFYDGVLIPMIQSARGCPYQCTFCWEGGPYFQKVKRYDLGRVKDEVRYIADRIGNVADLCIVDANFGMFGDDLELAHELSRIQKSHAHSWPRTILTATAKNHKERTMEIVDILGDTMPPTAAVQSTDTAVLKLIKRKNVANEVLAKMADRTMELGGQTEAEVILCLEGEGKASHFRTIVDMLDANMSFIRMYQFMMLPGTQSASRKTRETYAFMTRYRVLPRCFGWYRFRGDRFSCAEIEEIVVGTSTMPYEDYQACRDLHLTVEIFNNDWIFSDLMQYLRSFGIQRSVFISRLQDEIVSGRAGTALAGLYADYRAEEKKNLWTDLAEVEAFVQQPGVIQRYIDGEYGTNELYKYRALAVFPHIEDVHRVAYTIAARLIDEAGRSSEDVSEYLEDLRAFSLARKTDCLETGAVIRRSFHYDFPALVARSFRGDPRDARRTEGVEVEMYHSEQQKQLIGTYVKQYSTSLIGLGRILLRANMNRLYRTARIAGESLRAAG